MSTQASRQISLLEIRHQDLTAGLLRIQNFQIDKPYIWNTLSFSYLNYSIPGLLGRSCGSSTQSYKGWMNNTSDIRKGVKINGLRGAVIRIITLESFGSGNIRYGMLQIRNTKIIGNKINFNLTGTADQVVHPIPSIYPNYQRLEY
jgi:hypothetical protein